MFINPLDLGAVFEMEQSVVCEWASMIIVKELGVTVRWVVNLVNGVTWACIAGELLVTWPDKIVAC